MSLFSVPILTLASVEKHPHADLLDLAVVGGYRAVVQKDSFAAGQRVVYIPTDSIVPQDVALKLGIEKYLVGEHKDRVKAVRLRMILSEGIVLSTAQAQVCVTGVVLESLPDNTDVASYLGITKYEEVIPPELLAVARPWPTFLSKFDVPNIKRPEHVSVIAEGEMVQFTEKLHGNSMSVAFGPGLGDGERAYVCQHSLALQESDTISFWRAAHKYDLIEKLTAIRSALSDRGVEVKTLALYGELLGGQDLKYGFTSSSPGFAAFDLRLNGDWVDAKLFREHCERVSIPLVPLLYEGPFSYALLAQMAEEKSSFTPGAICEGIVVRPLEERRDLVAGRVLMKYVAGAYLTRRGKTSEAH